MSAGNATCPPGGMDLVFGILPSLAVVLVAYALPRNRATRWAVYAVMLWQMIEQERKIGACNMRGEAKPSQA